MLGRNNQASAAADDDMQAMQAVVNTEASGNVPKLDEGQTIALLQPAMHDGRCQRSACICHILKKH